MSVDIKFPNITATTDSAKIEQIRGYLYQLADQLKWALNSLNGDSSGKVLQMGSNSTTAVSKEEAKATFNSIKSLIISSADVVNAYYEVINKKFSGEYVAQSDFGTYVEQTEQSITTNSTAIDSIFTAMQEIITDIENIESNLIKVNAHIRSGQLYIAESGVPIYGLEIGQINSIDGVEVFNKYARFTSDRLSFYDQNDTEVAYISDYKLYITTAEIGTLILGRYVFDSSNGLTIKWV